MFEKAVMIIDFDSTFVTIEGLEELAQIALENHPRKKELVQKIQEITALGMAGKIEFNQSLQRRLQLFQPNKDHIQKLINLTKKSITPSIIRHKNYFQTHQNQIFIISGGFEDWIYPITDDFTIPRNHVLANRFYFDNQGNVTGYDLTNPLCHKEGKVQAVRQLKIKADSLVIGDGYTDYQIKEKGLAKSFFAFTENVSRKEVVALADKTLSSFDEFVAMYRKTD